MSALPQGTSTPLHRAHAGRTPGSQPDLREKPRRPVTSTLGVSMTEQLALTLAAASVGLVSAIFFCIGNAFNSVEKITLLSTSFWDFSEPVARALAAQRAQYVTGGLLLLASFALQVAAALASSTTPAPIPQFLYPWPYLVLAIFAPTALASWWGCRALNCLTTERVLRRHREQLAPQETQSSAGSA